MSSRAAAERNVWPAAEGLLRVLSVVQILTVPWTKVEESFNLQATHDLLFHNTNLDRYDHLEFPGVVPRSFIGPLILAVFSAPFVWISQFFCSKFAAQIIVRLCLSEIVIRAFQKFRQSICKEFGQSLGIWLLIITASQFHLMFYMGRTLPNILALPGALMAYHYWMSGKHGKFIFVAAFDSIVFRAELAMLFGMMLLYELVARRITLMRALKLAIPAGLLSLALTIVIDSVFWRRLLWPEGEVLFFNTVLNQSHKWGTEPFLWYFYSALPRALLVSVVLIPYGLWVNPRVRLIVTPCIIFVFLFSFLPHKELRFIFYVIPVLNVAAAAACDRLWKNRGRGCFQALVAVGLIFHIVLNGVLSTGFLIVSSKNYPGGNALQSLHAWEDSSTPVNVHIDVYSAQTGVSRFLELNSNWKYNKTENLEAGGKEILQFTHLLVGTLNVEDRYKYLKTHEVLTSIQGFQGINFKLSRFPPIRINTEPRVLVLRRKDHDF